ncbi:MAG: winged helix-turn-helix transcriptional regulator [Candidatus Diapherotrites archaeon]
MAKQAKFGGLDEKDRLILFELDCNSRQSNSQIAKKMAMDKNVVNYRINRLLREEFIVSFYTVIDKPLLGFQGIGIYLRVRFDTVEEEKGFVEAITSSPFTWWVGSISGEFNFGFVSYMKNIYEFEQFWEKITSKYKKFMLKSVVCPYTKVHDCAAAFLVPEKILDRPVQVVGETFGSISISDSEKKLLSALSENARLPTVELAKKTGISVSSIKLLMKNLKKNGIIKGFRARLNLEKMGLAMYKINFQLNDLDKYAEMVSFALAEPSTIYIDKSISFADLEIEILAERPEEMERFVKKFSAKFPGKVKDYDYFLFHKVHKIKYF